MSIDSTVQQMIDASLAPLQASLASIEARLHALESPIPPSPSGAHITTDIPAGWRETVRQEFKVDCAEGQFASTYPQATSGLGFYPRGYYDTRWKWNRSETIRGGEYSADFISVSGGICKQRMFVRNNVVQSCALVPIAIPGNGKWGDAPGMIVEHRSRFNYTAGLKSAHLLWPQSNVSFSATGGDGEIDFPEFEEDDFVSAFVHHQGATANNDQKWLGTSVDPKQWHTYRTIWKMGVSCEFLVDGVPIAPPYTTRIPAKPMHCVLQNESWLSSTPVPANAQGLIETDWIRVLVPA